MDLEVLSWKELVAVGGSVEKARRQLREGIYRRELHDAYVLGDVPADLQTKLACLLTVVPPDVALSHWAALWVLGLDVLPRDKAKVMLLDLTTDRERHLLARQGLRTHCARLTDDDLPEVNGIHVVSAARGVVDVARKFGFIEGVACGDAALRAGATTVDRIEAVLARSGGLRGVVRARAMIPHLEPRSESLMESRLRVGFVVAGGPRMHAQVDLYDDERVHRGRGDLFLDGMLVEYDVREQRLDRVRFTHDRRRGNGVSDLAVEVRRFSADDLYKATPRARLETLLRALEIACCRTRPRLRSGPDTLRPPKLTPLATRAGTAASRLGQANGVVLDYRVREQGVGDLRRLPERSGLVLRLEGELDVPPDAEAVRRREAQAREGVGHRLTLRVEDLRLEHDVNDDLVHGHAGQPTGRSSPSCGALERAVPTR
jgi:hypothetical protein